MKTIVSCKCANRRGASFFGVAMLAFVACLSGCQKGNPFYAGFREYPKERSISFYSDYPSGKAPFELQFRIMIWRTQADSKLEGADLIQKIEFDSGDGGGLREFKFDRNQLSFSTFDKYTQLQLQILYETPGEFLPKLRVTFFDGEILVDDGAKEALMITVLPAEET